MEMLRTPDNHFQHLPDYPFEPHYTEIDSGEGGSLRIHHIDEGDRAAPIVLCLHGQPSWSYLYRKMVPLLTASGLRVIAPDLPGYGKSDKPAAREDYSYQRQVDWMGRWLEANDFGDVTFFGQDWGGLIGLRMVVDHPDRFARVVVGNTGLPLTADLEQDIIAVLGPAARTRLGGTQDASDHSVLVKRIVADCHLLANLQRPTVPTVPTARALSGPQEG